VQAAAESDDGMNAVQYLVPLLGIAVAIAIIGRPRRRAPRPAPSPATLAEA
jgi:lipopolysaccharide export system permease protein